MRCSGQNGAALRLKKTGTGAFVPEYTHFDSQGSAVAATNAAGGRPLPWPSSPEIDPPDRFLALRATGSEGRERYAPFGEELLNPAGNANNTGYTGHLKDDATGLNYMQARYYDPVIGRFLSTDPIGYQDQLNLYAYVHNDPINNIDPNGEVAFAAVIPIARLAVQACASSAPCATAAAAAGAYAVAKAGEAVSAVAGAIFSNDDAAGSAGAEGAAEGTEDSKPTGDDVKIGEKIGGQLGPRGWTEQEVKDATKTPASGTSTDNTGGKDEPATVYGDKSGYVVVNDKSGEVVQVSDKTDSNWKPDPRINWND